jgi:cystathionine beta-lyase
MLKGSLAVKYNFDEPINRKGTYSFKWNGGDIVKSLGMTERFDEDTIPLNTADMDFQAPQPVLDALHKLIDTKVFGYSSNLCAPEYAEAIIRWFKTKRDWEIKREEILYVNGTVEAIKQVILTFSDETDGVIIQPPIYSPFSFTIKRTKRRIVNNPLINNDGYYTMDYDDLEEKAKDPNTKLLLLCNPHNPVGRVWKDEELKKISEICLKNNVIIVADEIHGDLLRKGQEFHPIATVVDNSNLITCTAINKTFNLAGLHCTNLVIKNPDLRAKVAETLGWCLPTPFAIAALIAAYNEGDEWLEQLIDYIDDNIDWVLNFLKEKMPKVKCFKPEGTYIIWMDFREYGLTAQEIHDKIYINANVFLEGGLQFDPENGAGFERICVPTTRALLQEALERIYREFEGL